MATKKVAPAKTGGDSRTLEDYNSIAVPIVPMRIELSQLQKDGLETIPLGELLRIVARVIKDAKVSTQG